MSKDFPRLGFTLTEEEKGLRNVKKSFTYYVKKKKSFKGYFLHFIAKIVFRKASLKWK